MKWRSRFKPYILELKRHANVYKFVDENMTECAQVEPLSISCFLSQTYERLLNRLINWKRGHFFVL